MTSSSDDQPFHDQRSDATSVRLIVEPPRPGADNMARDEALLISATGGVASFRLYGWSEPTLSLGYFQSHDDRAVHQASEACPLVRRHSGGGAIVHDQEWTYSLALPVGDERRAADHLVTAIHDSLATVLQHAGWPATLATGAERSPPGPVDRDGRPFLCFQRRATGDLLIGSSDGTAHKVGGSAQRRWRGAILQHGSVLLRQSHAAPELPGILDLSRSIGDRSAEGDGFLEDLKNSWLTEIASRLRWSWTPSTMTDDEVAQAHLARQNRFANRAWSVRR